MLVNHLSGIPLLYLVAKSYCCDILNVDTVVYYTSKLNKEVLI